MGELSRRGVKAFAVLSFMAFASCAIRGARCFSSFHTAPPQYAARAMQPTIRAERSHLSCGTGPRAPLNDVAQWGHAQAEAGWNQLRGILRVRRFESCRLRQKRRAAAFGNGHKARLKVRQRWFA